MHDPLLAIVSPLSPLFISGISPTSSLLPRSQLRRALWFSRRTQTGVTQYSTHTHRGNRGKRQQRQPLLPLANSLSLYLPACNQLANAGRAQVIGANSMPAACWLLKRLAPLARVQLRQARRAALGRRMSRGCRRCCRRRRRSLSSLLPRRRRKRLRMSLLGLPLELLFLVLAFLPHEDRCEGGLRVCTRVGCSGVRLQPRAPCTPVSCAGSPWPARAACSATMQGQTCTGGWPPPAPLWAPFMTCLGMAASSPPPPPPPLWRGCNPGCPRKSLLCG